MADGIEVKSEFEKIFGAPTERPTLFSPDDEQYNALRQYILNAPAVSYDKTSLPFNDVKIEPFDKYLRSKSIQDAESQGYHVFYLKSGRLNDSYDAIGYFDKNQNQFILMKTSKFKTSSLFKELIASRPPFIRAVFSYNGDECAVLKDVACPTVSLAATYVSGKRTDLFAWHDAYGGRIDSTFEQFKETSVLLREIESIKEKEPAVPIPPKVQAPVAPKPVETTPVSKKVEPKPAAAPNPIIEPTSDKHLFYLNSASGYYDQESNYFYICAGSKVSAYESADYKDTTSSKARARFLEKACSKSNGTYVVTKDAKCRNATAAACYVMGMTIDYTAWKDKSGKSLHDLYPERFYRGCETAPVPSPELMIPAPTPAPTLHIFYIEREIMAGVRCKADCYYDTVSDNVILRKGSLLASDVSTQVRFAASNGDRRMFLNQHCNKTPYGYTLKKDTLCESPAIAAYYATGIMPANGWMVWKDKDGNSMKEIYNK